MYVYGWLSRLLLRGQMQQSIRVVRAGRGNARNGRHDNCWPSSRANSMANMELGSFVVSAVLCRA